jgi:hypothetical protein
MRSPRKIFVMTNVSFEQAEKIGKARCLASRSVEKTSNNSSNISSNTAQSVMAKPIDLLRKYGILKMLQSASPAPARFSTKAPA